VFDKVRITYRGSRYEIGRGPDFYAIWTAGASGSRPLEWWPETPEGWSAAWARFVAIETPGSIAPVGQSAARSGLRGVAAGWPAIGSGAGPGAMFTALLLAVGVALGVAGLFPDYLGGTSLTQQPANLVPHVIYLATWTLSAGLIALGTRQRIGALLATGLSIVTFGLFFTDAGTVIAGGAHLAGAGLVLGLLGWVFCAAGSAVAFRLRSGGATRQAGPLGRPRGLGVGPLLMLVLAGLGAAVAFAPSWDSFTLRTAAGQTQSLTAGNAFANPGPVIAGDLAVMFAFAAVVVAAALWRPLRYGAFLLAGAIIPMAAQAISALVQVGKPAAPAQFGISPGQASQLGLTISSGLTPVFWIYCVFIVALAVSCAWMFFTPDAAPALLAEHSGAGAGADTEAEVWHVARAEGIGVAGIQQPIPGCDSSDDDDEFGNDERAGSGSLSGRVVTPGEWKEASGEG
jgi:hypothetical protein